MSVALATPRPAVVGVALNREARDFSVRDRAVLNHLRPHLSQAWRQSREHAQLKVLIDAATTALNATESGVILLDDPVHELTPGAFTELYRFFGRPPAETALPHRVERWVESERFKSENAGLGDYAKPLTTMRGGARLVLRYVPSRASHTAAILIRRADPEDASSQSAMLGLSPRETQVLNELIKGSSNAEIAAQLHLTPATVKKYLDHIYVKLGAKGRVQATAIAFSTPSANWGARPA